MRKTIEEFCPSKEGLQELDFLQLFFAGTEDHAYTEEIIEVTPPMNSCFLVVNF